ncbi:MAG: cystathionine beta-synthase [Planctomycetota bacterium]
MYDSILEAIGHTPMVRLNTIGRRTGCELLAKCEFLNAGGSVKDRIGKRMVEEAEKAGRIKPGDTLIEPTSGNTGIGMALAAAVKGYRMIITMPQKMSREKQVVLEALGAEIVRTPTEAAWDSPESHIGVAKRLEEILPNAHILDQYGNDDNPLAHYEGTGVEIVEQTGGKLDAMVMSVGTGGTITGVAKRLKEEIPGVHIVGVDPEGSILAGPGPIASYKVEGIGYDFIPDVLDRGLVDQWVKSRDRESFLMARRLIRQEGLLVGGSCGATVWAAMKVAEEMGPGKRIGVLLADSVRNYMTKFLDDTWMRESGFTESRWESNTVGDMLRSMPPRELHSARPTESVGEACTRMKEHGVSQLPVVETDGRLVGMIAESDVLSRIVHGHTTLEDTVAETMMRNPRTVHVDDDARSLTELFSEGFIGVAVDDHHQLQGVITKLDLVDFLTHSVETPA